MRWPRWEPRSWRAMIALWASIVGASVLTGFSVWLVRLLVQLAWSHPEVRAAVVEALAASNYALLTIIGAVLLSLGLAINRRTLKASAFGAVIEADGGEAVETKGAQPFGEVGDDLA